MSRKIITISILLAFVCSGQARADYAGDSQVFTGSTSYMAPNVLIIFDRSGSMGNNLPAPTYVYTTDYSSTCGTSGTSACSYSKNAVYRSTNSGWTLLVSNVNSITCTAARDKLRGYTDAGAAVSNPGRWSGNINTSSPYACAEWWEFWKSQDLRLGNYLNFLQSPSSEQQTKLEAAKDAICGLLDTVRENNRATGETNAQAEAKVRFGLMTFNSNNQGGYLACQIGTSYDTIKTTVRSFGADTWTPLAETLAEAGLYFAGKASWANSGTNYSSIRPIRYRCQQNYIIIMTDGISTKDKGDGNGTSIFTRSDYINGKSIGNRWQTSPKDYDKDNLDPGSYTDDGTHWLDDVAAFLYNEDLITVPTNGTFNDDAGVSFDDPGVERQHIKTYTIGFTANPADVDEKLLKSAAAEGNGDTGLACSTTTCSEKAWQGKYYAAQNASELSDALEGILRKVNIQNATFIAPVVPVSKTSGTYSGYSLYLGLFTPRSTAGWYGNLKKYGLASDGTIKMRDGTTDATDSDGIIKPVSRSCWFNIEDGRTVISGGAGKWAHDNPTSRTFYTRKTGTAMLPFNKTNILPADLGLDSADTSDRDDLVDFIRAEGSYIPGDADEEPKREWTVGDILHSKPATLHYGNNTLIFVGANDGFMHCFADNDNATRGAITDITDDTISEVWCFTPSDILPKLRGVKTDWDNDGHDYLVDGSPTVYSYSTDMLLTFGLRRGGNKYYTLDIGNVNTAGTYLGGYASPTFKWELGPTVTGLGETLGQSWSKPQACYWKTGTNTSTRALILAGGYDDVREDANSATATSPTGRAIFVVNASDGSLVKKFTSTEISGIDHCFIDFLAFDKNDNDYIDTLYAGNLGGQLIACRDWDSSRSENGNWSTRLLFTTPHSHTSTDRTLLKFEYPPDVALEAWGHYVYIGTGDREHPNIPASTTSSQVTIDRFYAIKNKWDSSTTLTESSLVDVSTYAYSTYNLDNAEGWYIKLNERLGEKVVSQPIVFNQIVYFTTYTPPSASAATDLCTTEELGESRLYALEYLTGKAAYNWNTANDTVDGSGNPLVVKDRTDRWKQLGGGIPTQPTLVVTSQGAKLVTASTGGLNVIDISGGTTVQRYYWKQQ